MESSLFKRQQLWLVRIAPRPLREDKYTLPMIPHLLRRTIKRLNSRLPIRPVNKNSPRQRHEPPQEWNLSQRLLGRDTAVWREDSAQHEHVEFGLVISDEHGWPGGEVLGALDDVEPYTGRKPHHPFEAACCGPLGDAAVAYQSQDN